MTASDDPQATAAARRHAALRALQLMDLTALNDSDTPASIQALAAAAVTPYGPPAALCVYPRFVAVAREALAAHGLRIPVATVANFPAGAADPERAAAETAAAVADGADEVDVVLPYRAFAAGDEAVASALVAACREAVGRAHLKVILETGELREPRLIRRASELAIEAGAHFIKTSTGKVPVNATPEAVALMLAAIRQSGRSVGCKAAGGVRTTADAQGYLDLCDAAMGPAWATPATFRFGASSLLGDLLATLGSARP